jgi:hypothetical protein
MAESRYKVRAIGAPFDVQFSSCSNIKPNNFSWTIDKAEWDVHIDRGIMYQPDFSTPKEKRYGWICESTFIIPDVYNFLIYNHTVLFNNYYNKIFTCDSSLLQLNSNFVFCPVGSNYPWVPKDQWSVYPKTKLCSMFCSPKKATEGHVYRHMIARLALDAGLDVFGGAHGTKRTVNDPRNPWNTKIDGVRDYMFSIVVENGVYDSYWTEKITDCFATGTIPVYCGTKKVLDFFDPDGIIFLELDKETETLNSLSKELYNSKLPAILNNFNIVNTIKLADEYLFDNIIK